MQEKPGITIEYCPRCGWLLRASWMAQELLTTFADELHSVRLQPAVVAGQFEITVGTEVVWNRKLHGGFPDIRELKQRVRDLVAPGKSLGHTDRTDP